MTATPGAHSVTATAGTVPANGTWKAGPVATESASRLRVDGRPPLFAARDTFVFTAANGAVSQSTVRLDAAGTRLRCDGRPVLLAGDAASDAGGNTLTAADPGRLRTERYPA
ncbi:hypothetical protein ACFVFS_16290 [Kitasatospora sp. NPDC057692]|uniref:hypothetical protein n=1 Tax=Kitasatospora sp. NPDC057692 TaxID=3346215 RepID=UPI0036CBFB77